MAKEFHLKSGALYLVAESAAGIYNSTQLSVLAKLCDDKAIVAKLTEDQRIGLVVPENELAEVSKTLMEAGIGLRHYQDGLHQPTSCIGALCSFHNQDALGSAVKLSEALAKIELTNPLKIGINGCPKNCVPTHTLDVSIIGDEKGYKLYIGGRNRQLPDLASFVAEDIPADALVAELLKIIEFYKQNATEGESLGELIERLGLSPFQELLKPYSQESLASVFDSPIADEENISAELSEIAPSVDEIKVPEQESDIPPPVEELVTEPTQTEATADELIGEMPQAEALVEDAASDAPQALALDEEVVAEEPQAAEVLVEAAAVESPQAEALVEDEDVVTEQPPAEVDVAPSQDLASATEESSAQSTENLDEFIVDEEVVETLPSPAHIDSSLSSVGTAADTWEFKSFRLDGKMGALLNFSNGASILLKMDEHAPSGDKSWTLGSQTFHIHWTPHTMTVECAELTLNLPRH